MIDTIHVDVHILELKYLKIRVNSIYSVHLAIWKKVLVSPNLNFEQFDAWVKRQSLFEFWYIRFLEYDDQYERC